jgi:phosphatidylglycerol---prolipoprotein diacylglyceryl transferase
MPLVHPQFDPVAISLGPVSVHWYGLMYLLGFAIFLLLGRWRARDDWRGMSAQDVEDLLFYGVLGVIIGGRLGYVLFYKPGHYLANPFEIIAIWKGGMSFHGGFLGVVLAFWLWARMRGKSFLTVTDFVAPLVPPGFGAVRFANFINGELWGRAADPAVWPWAMVFPQAHDGIARHPSQLYQAALEGIVLLALLWWFSRRPRARGAISALFLIGYGVQRFVVEFAREPDSFLGLLAAGLSMGQWLSLPMVIAGIVLWIFAHRQQPVISR